VAKLAASSKDEGTESVSSKCSVLNQKLDALIKTLDEESHAASQHVVMICRLITLYRCLLLLNSEVCLEERGILTELFLIFQYLIVDPLSV